MALDSDNNQIQVKDVVKVVDGPHSVGILFVWFADFVLLDVTVTSSHLWSNGNSNTNTFVCSKNKDTFYSHWQSSPTCG